MFELSLAFKYLIPRKRQLSASIISLLSIGVIALVVWLVIVFFSVTIGLERLWTEKMVALTAPLRVLPTEHYIDSYYFQVDAASLESDYTHKSLSEKLATQISDPYDPEIDPELPIGLPAPDLDENGELRDLVKLAFQAAATVGVPRDYEITVANLKLELIRPFSRDPHTFLSQASFLLSFDPHNPDLHRSLLPIEEEDRQNLQLQLSLQGRRSANILLEKSDDGYLLPKDGESYGVLIAQHFRDSGVKIGDRGYLSYHTPTASNIQEQRISIHVAGFYDPGIIGIGGKMVLIDKTITSLVRAGRKQQDDISTMGINVWIDDYRKADAAKEKINAELQRLGISKQWRVETYKEYEFTKVILQQLHSDRNLFSLIALIIILVACSNIITLLILLVNDKTKEIGVLRAMGATAGSIALIFGLCGLAMGIAGSLIGATLALLTLRFLNPIVDAMSALQGFDAFNATFYGETLPNALSGEALASVMVATALLSLFAALVPAVKAALLKPATVLRSE